MKFQTTKCAGVVDTHGFSAGVPSALSELRILCKPCGLFLCLIILIAQEAAELGAHIQLELWWNLWHRGTGTDIDAPERNLFLWNQAMINC